jgi:4-hydroxy-tetrahydrodipicolinate reductase
VPPRIAVCGATGRVGRRLTALIAESSDLELVAAVASPASSRLGERVNGVPITADLPPTTSPDVVIDFSSPAGTLALLPACVGRRIPVVVATTGFEPDQRAEVLNAAHHTAVLMSPNTSLVVNLLFQLTRITARTLAGKNFDVEIVERHHRLKKDAPSGTAAHFARIVQEQMGQTDIVHGRHGLTGERPAAEIGVHAVRGGDNVGEHQIIFSAVGETLELVHKGTSRDSYANGALAAARWLVGKPPGSYTMADVLDL